MFNFNSERKVSCACSCVCEWEYERVRRDYWKYFTYVDWKEGRVAATATEQQKILNVVVEEEERKATSGLSNWFWFSLSHSLAPLLNPFMHKKLLFYSSLSLLIVVVVVVVMEGIDCI
jgi:hypothetical protein